jgi:hypothetical protein
MSMLKMESGFVMDPIPDGRRPAAGTDMDGRA